MLRYLNKQNTISAQLIHADVDKLKDVAKEENGLAFMLIEETGESYNIIPPYAKLDDSVYDNFSAVMNLYLKRLIHLERC